MGGWGFIAFYLLKELTAGVEPLGPENKLIFAPGIITGTPIAGSGRNAVGAKSPLTGAFGAAEAGGFFGAEMKHAAVDCLIVEGKAEKPVYLWVHDGNVEIRDAQHLWGMRIGESEKAIRMELGDRLARSAQIGPGAEKLVRFACVINDLKHVAGRAGIGAVMGSKNLKAVVARGHERAKMADAENIRNMARVMSEYMKTKPKGPGGVECGLGTGAWMTAHVLLGNLPTRNFRDGEFANPEAISAQTIKETVRIRMESCYACPVCCKKVVSIDEPWKVAAIYGGPEYETLAAFGSNCGVEDLKAICRANELCQQYTIDTIGAGATIAFAMECFENGILSREDTDGIRLCFGNADAMVKMVEMIGERQGIGNVLAEGTRRLAEKFGKGAERLAINVKGQEVPMHDPRLKKALGLGYMVSPTGADHCHNWHEVDVGGFDRNKIRSFIDIVSWQVLDNCLLMCDSVPWSRNQKAKIVEYVTGWKISVSELVKISERALNMARVFNLREGFTDKDDSLPDRFFHPQTSGPLSAIAVDPEEIEEAKHIYYDEMGWDMDTGVPTESRLRKLEIGWLEDLIKRN
jgi:aldehyde:ferredoxin oxidoreductase